MGTTSAQRQAKYRQSRAYAGDNGERRINTWVSSGTALALGRLAKRYGVTQREMLERLVLAADQQILTTLDPDSSEWKEYFTVTA
ncbi:hypothetical protein GWC77_26655 [Paraburkholderia sp. NMBU_R16]|uniref:hypothetical protein n=1 Tax=Paraburkholderia sp. NMBU_R16 TaxID=2698676 RepID=UPI0015672EC1|nr:hypothetical protein [Paraburkholderia sp. NMBU_R16]NRO99465.1 hypothetical protein [Paraburkholderia sp. NMBU_R16]